MAFRSAKSIGKATRRWMDGSEENAHSPVPATKKTVTTLREFVLFARPRNSKKQVRGFSMSCMLDQVCSLAYLPTHVNQIINGLEHVVEGSTEAKRIHVVAIAFTVGVWFSNNVYGGMEFVDWA
ncbi:unnamed protein product [Brassica oleracea]|uniref:(rape) hypothetical protein n=1 Tax=Brassica napus TaxID=3708 RepID=A0A816I2F7_BRANA|nr:unnamed protein product [Brassica napus]